MKALDKKLVRDLRRAKGQVISIALVLACGVATVIGLVGTYRALARSRDAYYEAKGFPHIWAQVKRAPEPVADALRALPGVAEVETRIDQAVMLDLPDMPEPVSGRLQSLPDGRAATLRHLILREGRGVDATRSDEVLMLFASARAHGLRPGDRVAVLVGGRQVRLRIVGLVESPEFIYSVAAGSFVADERRFAALFMARAPLAALTNMEGAFDSVTLRLGPGAPERRILAEADAILAPWGSLGAIERRLQPSHFFVSGELEQIEAIGTRVPLIFMGIAAFLLHVVLTRLVQTHREQIAALRALGFTRREVRQHYLAQVAVIAVLGVAFGLVLGKLLGDLYVDIYTRFFRLPDLRFHFDLDLALFGVGIGLGVALLGGVRAAGAAARLPPAEAMRPPVPARYRRTLLSRLLPGRLLGTAGRMIVREIERRPGRALISVLGIGLGCATLVLARFSQDAMDSMFDQQFHRAMGADTTVSLVTPAPLEVLSSARHWPGVLAVEPMRAVPVRIRAGHMTRDIALTGLRRGDELRQVLGARGARHDMPEHGVMLTAYLAERFGLRVGDPVTLERLDGDRRTLTVPLTAVVDEATGLNAYMDLFELHRVLGEAPAASALSMRVDPGHRDEFHRQLKEMPGVASIASRQSLIEAWERSSGSISAGFTLIVVFSGTVICIGVVYNNGRVALSERSRDLASLRILGYTREEVAAVLTGEMAVHLVFAIPVGLVLGRLLVRALMASLDPEQYRMVLTISPTTDAFAALVALASAAVTSILIRRRLDRVDIASALKARD